MGYRVKVHVGKRVLFSHSYSSKKKALKAMPKTRGGFGVVKS